ncbi:MAG: hypothetical protein IRY99_11825 [Isosphaeraceae bacterium]|nr:hypothetical protein [Isosphaeraceae bacterium]
MATRIRAVLARGALVLAVAAGAAAPARAQYFGAGFGYPWYGYGGGFGYPWYGYGLLYPRFAYGPAYPSFGFPGGYSLAYGYGFTGTGLGYGYPGFGYGYGLPPFGYGYGLPFYGAGYGVPGLGFGYYGLGYGLGGLGFNQGYYGYGGTGLVAGLTPLAVASAISQRYLFGETGAPRSRLWYGSPSRSYVRSYVVPAAPVMTTTPSVAAPSAPGRRERVITPEGARR